MRSNLLTASICYLFVITVLGIYGAFYATFQPSPGTELCSKIISFVFVLYFLLVGLRFFIINRGKLERKFKSRRSLNTFIYFGVPFLVLVLALPNYATFAKAIPNIITGLFADSRDSVVVVTDKRRWGKRNRHEEIYISGYETGFPISEKIFNQISIGQEVPVKIQESKLGTRVSFKMP